MANASVEPQAAASRRFRLIAGPALAIILASSVPALAGSTTNAPPASELPAAPAAQPGSWRLDGPRDPQDRQLPEAVRSPECVGVDLVKTLQITDAANFAKFETSARSVLNGQGLLWRIEGRGAKPSYLFGTMHSSEAFAKTFDELVLRALRRSRIVATELPGASTRKVAAELRRLVANRSFRAAGGSLDELPPELQLQVETRLARTGIPSSIVEQLQPWYLALALSRSQCSTAQAGTDMETADARIERLAGEQGAALLGLETPVEQVEALASIPDHVALRMIREATEKSLKPEDVESTISGLYTTRRIGYLLAMRGPIWAGVFDGDGYADFISTFITRRNATMMQRALPILSGGEAFLAVGALHLPGQEGLVELIRRAGFSVTRIW